MEIQNPNNMKSMADDLHVPENTLAQSTIVYLRRKGCIGNLIKI